MGSKSNKTLNKKGGFGDVTVIGLALFAMFFGAGNLIFPPDIGVRDGSLWWLGFIFYFIADAGFALLAVIAMNRMGGNMDRVTGTAGRVPGTIINIAVILCIGPGLAIPRNGATTLDWMRRRLWSGQCSLSFFSASSCSLSSGLPLLLTSWDVS